MTFWRCPSLLLALALPPPQRKRRKMVIEA
jgi:hypothetical protein